MVLNVNEKQMNAMKTLMKNQKKLDRREFRTLFGQIQHGDPDDAMRGLTKILCRDLEKNFWKTHKRRKVR